VSICSLHSVSFKFISTEVQYLPSNKTHRLLGIPLSRAATDSFTEAIGEVVIVGCLVESCEMDRLKKGWIQPCHSMQRTMVNHQSLAGSWTTCQHEMDSNSKKIFNELKHSRKKLRKTTIMYYVKSFLDIFGVWMCMMSRMWGREIVCKKLQFPKIDCGTVAHVGEPNWNM